MEWATNLQASSLWSDVVVDSRLLQGAAASSSSSSSSTGKATAAAEEKKGGSASSAASVPPLLADLVALQTLPPPPPVAPDSSKDNKVKVGKEDEVSAEARKDDQSWRMAAFVVTSQVLASTSPSAMASEVKIRVLMLPVGADGAHDCGSGAGAAGGSSSSTSPGRSKASSGATTSAELSLPPPRTPPPTPQTLCIQVPGYDVEKSGPFRQLLMGASAKALILLAPACCAAVAIPDLDGQTTSSDVVVRAVPLLPAVGVSFVKVLWHPLSDAHAGVLLSDGNWQLLDLTKRASVAEPEVHLHVTFRTDSEQQSERSPGSKPEQAVDFEFAGPGAGVMGSMAGAWAAGAAEAVWLAVTVIFLSASGRISIFCPVLPGVAVFPRLALDALQASMVHSAGGVCMVWKLAAQWLEKTLLRQGNCRKVPVMSSSSAGEMMCVRHSLNLHGDSEDFYRCWTPLAQVFSEEYAGSDDQSPRSPRHAKAGYCSVHLVAHTPVVVVVRATTTGLLEALILNRAIEPTFDRKGAVGQGTDLALTCTVFEEIDLALSPTKQPSLKIMPLPPWCMASAHDGQAGALFLVRTRMLVAVVELPWVIALACGGSSMVEDMRMANVITIDEVRQAESGSEGVGLQLCVPPPSSSSSSSHSKQAGTGSQPPAVWALWLRARAEASGASSTSASARAASSSKPQSKARMLDITSALRSSIKSTADAKQTESQEKQSQKKKEQQKEKERDRERSLATPTDSKKECLKHLRVPAMLQKDIFNGTAGDTPQRASAVAEAVANAQESALADFASRHVLLKHLAANAPKRAAAVSAEFADLQEASKKVISDASETEAMADRIMARQKELEELQASVAGALADEVELLELDRVAAEELPGLWSRLHELRRSLDLLRLSAASPDGGSAPPEEDGTALLDPKRLASMEELQESWTKQSSERLSILVAEAEAAVALAAQRSAGAPRESS